MINETDLRDAFTARASEVPAAAVARVRSAEYRPRTRRLGRPLAVGALAGAGSTAAVVLSVVGLGTSASNAFAGWTRTPTHALGAQAAHAQVTCNAAMNTRVAGGPTLPPLQPVLTDTRGPFTVVVLVGTDATSTCITGPGFTSMSGSAGPGVTDVPAGRINLSSEHFTTRDGAPYTIVEGHVGAGVSAVALALDDGTTVKTTIGNGWFTAWWPGSHDATNAIVTAPSGTTTQALSHHRPGGGVGSTAEFGSSSGGGGPGKGMTERSRSFSTSG